MTNGSIVIISVTFSLHPAFFPFLSLLTEQLEAWLENPTEDRKKNKEKEFQLFLSKSAILKLLTIKG